MIPKRGYPNEFPYRVEFEWIGLTVRQVSMVHFDVGRRIVLQPIDHRIFFGRSELQVKQVGGVTDCNGVNA
jgi:hypothetical protein